MLKKTFLVGRMYKSHLKQPGSQSFLCETQPRFPEKKKIFLSKVSQAQVWLIVISFLLNEVTPSLVSVTWFGRTSTTTKFQGLQTPKQANQWTPILWIMVWGSRHMILNKGQWGVNDIFWTPFSADATDDYFLTDANKEECSHESGGQPPCDAPKKSLPKISTNTKKPEMRKRDFLCALNHTSPETTPKLFKWVGQHIPFIVKRSWKKFPTISNTDS